MLCPFCKAANDECAEACFLCGKPLFILTQGTLLASRYEILGTVGQGGMSRVYKAHDRVLSETVAIKVLRSELSWDPVLTARFLSEIKLARKVSHRNVCRIHEYGEDRGVRYISMEFIDGGNLKDRLRNGGLPVAEAFDLVAQLAEGLAAVHAGGIIHRDLKASNIMIDSRGVVKLMDFGIAKQAAKDTDWSLGSGGGHVMGTPEYMSPEQARGGKLDFRSDIYSLGCVVFEIFTGRAPFKGQTPVDTLFKQVNEEPPLPDADLPMALVPILRKTLAKKPDERFPDIEGFLAALRRAESGLDPGHLL
jgi:serine/threonine-protein kinase